MRAKHHRAVIFDTDSLLALKVHAIVSKLFPSTNIQNNAQLFVVDYGQIRPDVVFLNLNASARDVSFKFLESHAKSADKAYVFAYMDKIDPEIVAHAIENGVQDFFSKPFDESIIATKINRLIKNELTVDQSLSYNRITPPVSVMLDLPLKVVGVDENGITFESPYYVNKGTKLNIASPLIQEIFSVPSFEMMVVKTWLDGKKYHLFVEPWMASEEMSSALRRFILSKI